MVGEGENMIFLNTLDRLLRLPHALARCAALSCAVSSCVVCPLLACRGFGACRRLGVYRGLWGPLLLAALCLFAGASFGQTHKAGKVSFVAGQVEAVSATGEPRRLAAGDWVYAGERVDTGPNGFAYLRMVDQAFLALRPGTSLKIAVYEFDAARPEASRIGLELERGSVRSVTGKGGERAKDKFRLDTPLAAIGIRGTDFTVFSLDEATRVEISRGAVVVSPLGNGCRAGQLGPCEGALARELNASMERAFIEVHPGRMIRLQEVKLDASRLAPNSHTVGSLPGSGLAGYGSRQLTEGSSASALAPAQAQAPLTPMASSEPTQLVANAPWPFAASGPVGVTAAEEVHRSASASRRAMDLAAAIQAVPPAVVPAPAALPPVEAAPAAPPPVAPTAKEVLPAVEPAPPVMPPATHSVTWGRWSSVVQASGAGSPDIDKAFARMASDFWLAGANEIFAMAYPKSLSTSLLPQSGSLDLRLQAAEAYVQQGATISPVAVRDGKLSLDFLSGRFMSQLGFAAASPVPAQLSLQGQFDAYGRLKLDAGLSDTRLQGMLFKSGAEAAFVFDKDLAGSAKLIGATAWGK